MIIILTLLRSSEANLNQIFPSRYFPLLKYVDIISQQITHLIFASDLMSNEIQAIIARSRALLYLYFTWFSNYFSGQRLKVSCRKNRHMGAHVHATELLSSVYKQVMSLGWHCKDKLHIPANIITIMIIIGFYFITLIVLFIIRDSVADIEMATYLRGRALNRACRQGVGPI